MSSTQQLADYEIVVNAIKATRLRINADNKGWPSDAKDYQLRGVRRAAAHLADAFAENDPTLDVQRFLIACGYSA